MLIAHALIGRPKLLLLDEPLANLDLRSGQEIVALLARIAREQRIAILISAHDMNPLLRVMDRIVYLADGRAASGTTDRGRPLDVLSELYGHHVDVLQVHGRVLVVAGAARRARRHRRPRPRPAAGGDRVVTALAADRSRRDSSAARRCTTAPRSAPSSRS